MTFQNNLVSWKLHSDLYMQWYSNCENRVSLHLLTQINDTFNFLWYTKPIESINELFSNKYKPQKKILHSLLNVSQTNNNTNNKQLDTTMICLLLTDILTFFFKYSFHIKINIHFTFTTGTAKFGLLQKKNATSFN